MFRKGTRATHNHGPGRMSVCDGWQRSAHVAYHADEPTSQSACQSSVASSSCQLDARRMGCCESGSD